jgi:hypothetical protein
LTRAVSFCRAVLCCAVQISCVCSSYDGRYLLTAGATDKAVNLWAVSVHALEATIALGGSGVDPFMNLIDGGKSGAFYQDLLDYFYYAQLRSQGIESTRPRAISGYIPVSEVVALMRALGYYPTEQEIRDLNTEIQFMDWERTGTAPGAGAGAGVAAGGSKPKTSVNLEEFIRLYVNYRPVFGLGKNEFDRAFKALIDSSTVAQLQAMLSAATAAQHRMQQALSAQLAREKKAAAAAAAAAAGVAGAMGAAGSAAAAGAAAAAARAEAEAVKTAASVEAAAKAGAELKRLVDVLLPDGSSALSNASTPVLTRDALIHKLRTTGMAAPHLSLSPSPVRVLTLTVLLRLSPVRRLTGEALSDAELKSCLKVLLGVDERQIRAVTDAAAAAAAGGPAGAGAAAGGGSPSGARKLSLHRPPTHTRGQSSIDTGAGGSTAGGADSARSDAAGADPVMGHLMGLIPPLLTPEVFAQHVLGFEDYNNQHSDSSAAGEEPAS